jgi:predicted metal-dependent peptidase
MNHEKNQKILDKLSQGLTAECPEFYSILLYAPKIAVVGDFVAKTDGKIVKLGEQFFKMSLGRQIYKILHITMHLALRHHHRAYELKGADPLYHKIWEVSTDVIINETIREYVEKKVQRIKEDLDFESEEFITRNSLRGQLKEVGYNIDDPQEFTAEKIFIAIVKGVREGSIPVIGLPLPDDSNLELSTEEFDETQDVMNKNGLGEEAEGESNNSSLSDLLWDKRVQKVLKEAGEALGSQMMGLLKHLYKPKINWQAILRSYLNNRLSPEKQADYTRPSRRNLAGVTKFFEPNRIRKRAIKTMVVCLDTSGSCWDSLTMSKFVSNIDSIHQITHSNLVVIIFDYGVHEVFEVKFEESLAELINNKRVNITGGGGTSFIAPINKAIEFNPDVIAVFTDCYGPFGDDPKIPTIWATIGDPAPWGKSIVIEED